MLASQIDQAGVTDVMLEQRNTGTQTKETQHSPRTQKKRLKMTTGRAQNVVPQWGATKVGSAASAGAERALCAQDQAQALGKLQGAGFIL